MERRGFYGEVLWQSPLALKTELERRWYGIDLNEYKQARLDDLQRRSPWVPRVTPKQLTYFKAQEEKMNKEDEERIKAWEKRQEEREKETEQKDPLQQWEEENPQPNYEDYDHDLDEYLRDQKTWKAKKRSFMRSLKMYVDDTSSEEESDLEPRDDKRQRTD